MLTNPRKNYLGLKYGRERRDYMESNIMNEMGNYQYDLYPWPTPNRGVVRFGEETIAPQSDGGVVITNSFGMSPELKHHLTSMGIMGNYQYDLYPWPAPNRGVVRFGKKKVRRTKKRSNVKKGGGKKV